MDERNKKKEQWTAELIGTYGIAPPVRLTYEQWFGLFLNIQRTENRRGFLILNAIMSGLERQIPKEYWEAVCHTDEEAEYRAQQHIDRQAFYSRSRGQLQ